MIKKNRKISVKDADDVYLTKSILPFDRFFITTKIAALLIKRRIIPRLRKI